MWKMTLSAVAYGCSKYEDLKTLDMEKSLIHTKFTDTLSPDYTTGSQSIKVSCLMFEK